MTENEKRRKMSHIKKVVIGCFVEELNKVGKIKLSDSRIASNIINDIDRKMIVIKYCKKG